MPEQPPSGESRIEELFHALLALPAEQRRTYLDSQAALDRATRDQVLEMVSIADEQPDLLEPPVERPAPERLGKYEILGELGRGGMGVVYRARDTQLGRELAVKVLPERLARDDQSLARFEREARLLAALNNENIATLFSLEEDAGVRYLTMEYVAGETLATILRDGPLPREKALGIARQTARALAAAHAGQIVHRDLKPANIMITPEGQAKVLDFGIAKALETGPDAGSGAAVVEGNMTTAIGTPGYMSPEQLAGGPVDRRADIWAFGCLLFEMMTGKRAVSPEGMIPGSGLAFAAPDLDVLPADLPRPVRSLLTECLRLDPELRLDSAAAICEALDQVEAAAARRGSGPGKAGWVLAVFAAVAVLVVVGVLQDRSSEDTWDFTHTPLTGDGKTRNSAISPDGSMLAYTHDGEGNFGLRLKQIDSGREKQIVPQAENDIRSPIFSPDGEFVYFTQAGPDDRMDNMAEYDLFRISSTGGSRQKITEEILARRFAVSPDGKQLAYKRIAGDSLRIMIRDVEDDQEWILASQANDITVLCCLAWSASGSEIITTVRDSVSGEIRIQSFAGTGGAPRQWPGGGWQVIMDVHALADGSGLLVLGLPVRDRADLNLNLYFLPQDNEEILALTDDITNYTQVSADRTGTRLALSYYSFKRDLRLHDAEYPGPFKNVSTDVVARGRVVWTPDGRLLTNQRVGDGLGLAYLSSEGTVVELVDTESQYIPGMDLTRDGGTLAYTSFQGQEFSIWLADPHGGMPRLMAPGEGNQRFPVFGPDGNWLLYCLQPGTEGPFYLHRIELDGSMASTRLAEAPALSPDLSPDGSQVIAAVLNPETGKYASAIIPASGGEARYLDLPGEFQPLGWGRTDDELICSRREDGVLDLWSLPLGGGDPRRITNYAPGHRSIPDVAWNARRDSLAVCLEIVAFDALLLARETP